METGTIDNTKNGFSMKYEKYLCLFLQGKSIISEGINKSNTKINEEYAMQSQE